MICSQEIYKKANAVIRRCGTREPFEIAGELGISLYFEHFSKLLGMYTYRWRHRMIFINDSISETAARTVLAHELGHDTLHRSFASQGMREYALFGLKDDTEQAANAFAAHLLLDWDELYETLLGGFTVTQAAASFNVPSELILIKLAQMKNLGCNIHLPDYANSNFITGLR